ncbi:MAG: 4-hydroxy-tetrahydrodipicolinate reductase [Candidatus Anoxychlamydiales bacterium]|nr:4-hydroxy-tetrahydrodipicolinate reductase [Candidatus Anoxychlamydiales bacterium]NGX36570.1 4-hydroxy-tetrahydrodipicolinate reductase [Candidatus Anoxychlamydiales bacterium]
MKIFASIIGYNGKMGKEIKKAAKNHPLEIIGGVGKDDIDNLKKIFKKADVAIDFSSREALDTILQYAIKTSTPLVIGTTGYRDEDFEKIKIASKKIAIFYSSNFSIGIALLRSLCEKSLKIFPKSSVDIIEKHHILKKDKPSGTALTIEKDLKKVLKNKINIHSIRVPNTAFEHSIIFANPDETIEIKHTADSRAVFANGALRAAYFIYNKKTGLYSIKDLFGSI